MSSYVTTEPGLGPTRPNAELSTWPSVPLADLGAIVTGSTPPTSQEHFFGGDVPFVTPADLDLSDPINVTPRTLSNAGTNAVRLLPKDAVLVCCIGSLGKTGIAGRPLATNQQINAVIFDEKRLCPRYGFHACRRLKQRLEAMAPATTLAIVSKSKFSALEIPVPPMHMQQRIAAILDQADSLRRLRQRAIDRLNFLLRSTFLILFGDPVTNPIGFPIRSLPEFYISQQEGTKCGPFGSALRKDELVESGVPVWNMDNIDISGRTVSPFRMWITEEKYKELQTYTVVDGDVLISRAGTVGKMCVANSGGAASIISTNLIRVRFGPDLLPIYFVSLMTYCKGRVGRLKTGPDGAFTHMNTGVLDTLKFPYPPLRLQRRFAAIVESFEQQRARLLNHLAELDALFASLQHRAFRGEL